MTRVREHCRHRGPQPSGQSGLSLIEVIIVLMISSLILSAVLPISLRAVSANHRLGTNIINLSDRDIAEEVFRQVFASATPLTFGDDRPSSTLEGNVEGVRISLRRGGAILCGDGAYSTIELKIVESGAGGLLVCEAEGRQRTLHSWRSGEASFAYSLDGKAWAPVWPPSPSTTNRPSRLSSSDIGPLRRNVVSAPLVRFEVVGERGQAETRWIAQSGDVEPLVYDPSADIDWDGPGAFENLP